MNESNILLYESDEGKVTVDVILKDETIWLTQKSMAELFDVEQPAIAKHLINIYNEKELNKDSTNSKMELVQKEGKRNVKRKVDFYNLDAIIAVGYRVNSKKATKFRIWATKILKEYMIKGFSLNDERLKNNNQNPYFEELLARIRDIRSSEKVFWRKVLDIYSTSIDYDPKSDVSIKFFKTVQNKMHFAAHGQTAAEVIFNRVDSNKDNVGLASFSGDMPTKSETEIAKNYLTEEELNILNRMVAAYLDVAEINALSHNPMTMQNWIEELDTFLKMTRKDILKDNGKISHKKALEKAHQEYDKYMQTHLTRAEKDYIDILKENIKDLN